MLAVASSLLSSGRRDAPVTYFGPIYIFNLLGATAHCLVISHSGIILGLYLFLSARLVFVGAPILSMTRGCHTKLLLTESKQWLLIECRGSNGVCYWSESNCIRFITTCLLH